ncbi:MAG: phosphatase PAP2 family protein [Phycisphaeraceae bacterium]|nr:phosphatase PAP2 family protein [Phycisphaeraceae bacterium]
MDTDYTGCTNRRRWLWLLVPLAAAILVLPWDGQLARLGESLGGRMRGDLRREIHFIQQYGAITSAVLIGLVILRLDPARKARVADMALALAATSIAALLLKIGFGRPRPKFDDPFGFVSVFGDYPVLADGGTRFSWQIGQKDVAQLWSMPSSHTSAAFALSTVLYCLYPRLGLIVWPVAVIVGAARWLTESHYISDIFVGATLGILVSGIIMQRRVISRRLDRRTLSTPAPQGR